VVRLAVETDAWSDPVWQGYKLEQTYHLLCADPTKALSTALAEVVAACRWSTSIAARWAQMIAQAGEDAGSDKVRVWGRRLVESTGMTEYEADIASMGLLIAEGGLADATRAVAFQLRGGR